ncbi:HlyD family secretion protein [uncultured Pseudodesulfovibrio sp.]|uniref:HlyD family secretion protein n=1 Tax=uncultured Pseudodesulfovibrio sp. TaxID=2035858 RepID=UPI0029C8B826|nr:HlyD family secretion protein [uncultured Pseudodesulfovibrio sp.]
MKSHLKKWLLTGLVVLCAILTVALRYREHIFNPWTRDGQVRADVVQIMPRISGPIVNLHVIDNQFVHKGDLLFEIDPRTYSAALDEAKANLDQADDQIQNRLEQVNSAAAALKQALTRVNNARFGLTSAQAHFDEASKDLGRFEALLADGTVARRDYDMNHETAVTAEAQLNQAKAQLDQAKAAKIQAEAELAQARAVLGASGQKNPLLREALARWEQARLNLEFTKVRAPVDGWVTNLTLRQGSQAVANRAMLALIDADSFWVAGYFRESSLASIQKGDKAIVTLMTYPDTPLSGNVDSIGYGISQADGASGHELLPSVSPTFEWIRLAQRVPVRVHLDQLPPEVALRVGTTASVLIETR